MWPTSTSDLDSVAIEPANAVASLAAVFTKAWNTGCREFDAVGYARLYGIDG